jgi:general stress protein YciG
MSGTVDGGKQAAETNRERYGDDYYKVIGSKGGMRTIADGAKPKGFAQDIERARIAGAKGGKISKRPKRNA